MRGAETSYRGTTFSERMALAPCMQTDPELSFPAGEGKRGNGKDKREAQAKEICKACPLSIQQECLELAMKTEGTASASMRHGVYGGLDPDQRAALARERTERAATRPELVRVEQDALGGANKTPVGPAIGHLRTLLAAGHTRTEIANASGVSHSVICTLAANAPRFIKGSTYVALMSVREAEAVSA